MDRLTREKLEEFLSRIGANCIVVEERDRYFILSCTKKGKYEVQKRIVEELGYPASIIGKREIYVYRMKPEAKARVELDYDVVKQRLDPEDRDSAFGYGVPKLCLVGNTYPVKEVLKSYGFKFEPLRKAWCRIFNSFSELRSFVKDSLPSLIQECAEKGVAVELSDDELKDAVERLRNELEWHNKTSFISFFRFYATTKGDPDVVSEVARSVGEDEVADQVERIAKEFDSFGDAVEVVAMPRSSNALLVCARPRKYLGKQLFRAFVEKARSLGMSSIDTNTYCETVHAEKTPLVYEEAVYALARAETDEPEAINEALEYLKHKGIQIDRETFEKLVHRVKHAFYDVVTKAKSKLLEVLT